MEPDPALRTEAVVGRTVATFETPGRPAVTWEVEHPLGGAQRPLSLETCTRKFLDCAEYAVRPLAAERLRTLVERVAHLETLEDVSGLPALLT